MTRRSLFAGLLGAAGTAGAQEVELFTARRVPPNGQCPQCKAQAEPYERETGPKRVVACMDQYGVAYSLVREGDGNTRPYGSNARIARCRACNNAFFQDAEPPK